MVVFDEDKLCFAVLFEKYENSKLRFPIFLPKRSMIGTINEDRSVFTELSSGIKYLNFYNIWRTGLSCGFELCISVKDILEETDSNDLGEIFSNLWNYFENNVYFYGIVENSSEYSFLFKDKCEFMEEFGVDFRSVSTNDSNKLLDDYVEGKLTTDEYYSKVYRKTSNNVITLFPKK